MDAMAFQDQLRRTGQYHTPDGARSVVDRLLGRFDGWYYAQVLRTVFAGRRVAFAGRYDAAAWADSSFATLRAVERCGGRIHIEGLQAVAAVGGSAVIIANHMSMAETFLLPVILLTHRDACFIVKQSLLTNPIFGPIMRAVNPIAVTRTHPRQDLKDVLDLGRRALDAGRLVVVFPQATRSVAFVPAAFNSLGAKLAARAGVPVVPLALKTDFQGNGRRIKEFGPLDRRQEMYYHFGMPLPPANGEKAVQAAVVAFIRERLTAWGGIVQESPAAAGPTEVPTA